MVGVQHGVVGITLSSRDLNVSGSFVPFDRNGLESFALLLGDKIKDDTSGRDGHTTVPVARNGRGGLREVAQADTSITSDSGVIIQLYLERGLYAVITVEAGSRNTLRKQLKSTRRIDIAGTIVIEALIRSHSTVDDLTVVRDANVESLALGGTSNDTRVLLTDGIAFTDTTKVANCVASILQGSALEVRVDKLDGRADLLVTVDDLVGGKLRVQGTSGTLANIGKTDRIGHEGDGKIGRGGGTTLIIAKESHLEGVVLCGIPHVDGVAAVGGVLISQKSGLF